MKKYLRFIIYFIGIVILSLGLILNTKSGMGVSPIISVAYSVSEIFNLDFGNITLILYSAFIAVELILNNKNRMLTVLQLPFSIVFTRLLNMFNAKLPNLDNVSFAGRFLVLILAIILTGIGAATVLSMKVVPNPPDGLVQSVAEKLNKTVGNVKNIFDLICLIITCTLGFVLCGKIIGIGVGTVCAMLGVGRVIAVYQKIMGPKLDKAINV
ncbi:MAG: DUF6198 family protein [Erysipelotrichaceae bacterium]|nr:DUF6198 family protein [Erysipelotrichaceae bacterium]